MVRAQIGRESKKCRKSRHVNRASSRVVDDGCNKLCSLYKRGAVVMSTWLLASLCYLHFNFLKKASHLISLSFFHVLRTPHSQGLSGPLSFLFHVHSTTQQINLQILTIYQSLIHSINHPSHFLSLSFTHSLTHSIQLLPFTTTIQ